MPARHLPVRPDLDQLKRQAKDLLSQIRQGDPEALAEFSAHFPRTIPPADIRLAHVQRALAHSYGVSSWPRLALACRMTAALWNGDTAAVRHLLVEHPHLLNENARGVAHCNWGPPLSYAANVGRNDLVTMLREWGAEGVQHAFERACLQGKLETARLLYRLGGRPLRGSVLGPCETLSGEGLALMLELGGELCDTDGDPLAPIGMLLETYTRRPAGKHACLELMARHGVALPHTAPVAVHRGRIDLLEELLAQDSGLLRRNFDHEAIYPRALGCHQDPSLALHGTPIAGGTLLHLAVDFDEIEIARWLLDQGADVNARAALDPEGFGGHTALFGCVVSQPYRAHHRTDDVFARLLLDRGAEVNPVVSLRKRLRFVEDETEHLYRNVTPLAWGRRFHDQDWVNPAVTALIAERGGHD